jgi:hypothetical protein
VARGTGIRDAAYNGARYAVYRLRRYAGKYGWPSFMHRTVRAVRQAMLLDETHLWFQRTLGVDDPDERMPPEITLRQASADTVELIEALPTVSLADARRRMERGVELWLLFDGDRPVVAAWFFRTTMPMIGAPRRAVTAPPGVVFLEDAVTAPDYRGQRLVRLFVRRLSVEFHRQGLTFIVCKVADTNVSSLRAVAALGFVEIGRTHFRRILGRRQIEMTEAKGPVGEHLSRQFGSPGSGPGATGGTSGPGAGHPDPDDLEPRRVRLEEHPRAEE